MNNIYVLFFCSIAGIVLGCFFFIGLWWTVQKGLESRSPGFLFLGSRILRTAVVIAGFYFIGNGSWQRMASCLLGFYIARLSGLHFRRESRVINES